jgi:serine/threonine-protein kinase
MTAHHEERSFDGSSPLGNRYVLLRFVSRSSHGPLYEAFDMVGGRLVALKVLEDSGAMNDEPWRRYVRGLDVLRRITHKNIVQYLDAGQTPELKPFVVFEWVPGAPLSRFIQARGSIPLPDAAGALCQVLEGLEAAHGAGIVHRDVTPGHILVVPTDHGAIAKLFGFGIAKSTAEPAANLTRVGRAIGTPRYMSPEQFMGMAVDHRSDVYSAGLVLYEALAGKPAYPGESFADLARLVLKGEVPPLPPTVPTDVRTDAGPILQRSLARDVNRRYPTVRAFREDLEPLSGTLAAGSDEIDPLIG